MNKSIVLKNIAMSLLVAIFLSGCASSEKQIEPQKKLRHVVTLKFKDSATEEQVKKLSLDFAALEEKIPAIQDFEWGVIDSPEDLHEDFTHSFMMTFHSEQDRDQGYTLHPAHDAFVKTLLPQMDKIFVIDYWTDE